MDDYVTMARSYVLVTQGYEEMHQEYMDHLEQSLIDMSRMESWVGAVTPDRFKAAEAIVQTCARMFADKKKKLEGWKRHCSEIPDNSDDSRTRPGFATTVHESDPKSFAMVPFAKDPPDATGPDGEAISKNVECVCALPFGL